MLRRPPSDQANRDRLTVCNELEPALFSGIPRFLRPYLALDLSHESDRSGYVGDVLDVGCRIAYSV
jgi:hypothetical protein